MFEGLKPVLRNLEKKVTQAIIKNRGVGTHGDQRVDAFRAGDPTEALEGLSRRPAARVRLEACCGWRQAAICTTWVTSTHVAPPIGRMPTHIHRARHGPSKNVSLARLPPTRNTKGRECGLNPETLSAWNKSEQRTSAGRRACFLCDPLAASIYRSADSHGAAISAFRKPRSSSRPSGKW